MADSTDPSDRDDIDEDNGGPVELDLEAPREDAAEQHTPLRPRRDIPIRSGELDQADPGDAAEQHRVVDLDEDDYRE